MHNIWSSGGFFFLTHVCLSIWVWQESNGWWLVVVADSEHAQLSVELCVRVDFFTFLRLTWQAPRLKVRFSHPASSARIPLSSGALAFSVTEWGGSSWVEWTATWPAAGELIKRVENRRKLSANAVTLLDTSEWQWPARDFGRGNGFGGRSVLHRWDYR